jgi:hypothetical protein
MNNGFHRHWRFVTMQYDIDNFASRAVGDVEVSRNIVGHEDLHPSRQFDVVGKLGFATLSTFIVRREREFLSKRQWPLPYTVLCQAYKQLLSGGAALFAGRKLVPLSITNGRCIEESRERRLPMVHFESHPTDDKCVQCCKIGFLHLSLSQVAEQFVPNWISYSHLLLLRITTVSNTS